MECENCHKIKDDVFSGFDPYEEEINNVKIEVNLCHDCYDLYCDEI